ncbi:MAG: Rieske (2Fe-2S) protein [Gemmatimonadaceae bacterium]|nr:Rieske (2Fe-2S) protein [Gemmatimonadaceae bacterium]
MTEQGVPLTRDDSAPEESRKVLRRRRFLVTLSGVLGAFAGLLATAPSLMALFSPVFRKPAASRWTKVIDDVNTVDVGVPFKVDFTETINDAWIETRALRSVWLYTDDAVSFRAFSSVCTHLGCSVGHDAEQKRFHCPCHHGLFDVKTGEVLGGPPPRPLDSLPVKVVDGEVFIQHLTFRTGIASKVET